MPFEQKLNNGSLFVNDRNPERSDLTGRIDVECTECHKVSKFWMNAWRKTAKSGVEYIALALRPRSDPPRDDEGGRRLN